MVLKRKLDDVEKEEMVNTNVDPLPPESRSSRQMQGQVEGANKHSIDSDDEDDDRKAEAKFDKMKDDDIEGQEDNTLDNDDGIQITPFNLKEEQQEGSFSKDGNFVWDKKDEIKDAWLDDIDWVKVKNKSQKEKDREEQEDEIEDEKQENYSEIENYKLMIEVMRPGETVAKVRINV
jgi:CD2 antigen cytoplasmic tail-binding protein 2